MGNIRESEPLIGAPLPEPAEFDGGGGREQLLELLRAYRAVGVALDGMPQVVWMRATDGAVGRHISLPRLQWFARRLAAFHIARSVCTLKRGFYAAAAIDEHSSVDPRDIARLDNFERSLSPVSTRRILVYGLGSCFLVAYAIANLFHAHQTKFIGDFTRSVVELDRRGAVGAFNEITTTRLAGAAILCLWAVWLVSLLPSMAFGLKRGAFTLPGASADEIASTGARSRMSSTGVYRLEHQMFTTSGLRPPRELPLDLAGRTMLILSLAIWGIWLILTKEKPDQLIGGVVFLAIAIAAGFRARSKVLRRWALEPPDHETPVTGPSLLRARKVRR